MNFLKSIFLCVFILLIGVCLNAQSYENVQVGEESERSIRVINAIKEGTIVVILLTQANKIDNLISTLRSKNLNTNLKNRLKDQLFETVVKTERQNKYLIEFFTKYYSFSDLRFMYDTSMLHLNNGVTQSIFVDENLYISDTIKLDKAIGGFIRIGRSNNQGMGILGLLVCDEKNKVMDTPFPYNIILPDGDSLESERAFFEQAIERTAIRIEKFYLSDRTELYKQ